MAIAVGSFAGFWRVTSSCAWRKSGSCGEPVEARMAKGAWPAYGKLAAEPARKTIMPVPHSSMTAEADVRPEMEWTREPAAALPAQRGLVSGIAREEWLVGF